MRVMKSILVLAATVAALGLARADEFPSKPIKIVVPYTAGGATDTLARTLADKLSQMFGHRAFVENKPGASGLIAAKMVADADKDGHTILFSDSSIFVIVPHTKAQSAWDFAPIAVVARQVPVLAVNKSLPIKDVKELLQAGKDNPDKLTYGTFGIAT